MDDFTKQLLESMQQYSADVQKNVEGVLKKVGEEAKNKVKATSPKRTGKYQRGWKVDFQSRNGQISCVIHQNGKNYRLTHLLEHGHKTRNGGRVKAQPHIAAVEEWAEREALKEIEKAVKG